ncbi:class I SAM-dependent methyltransferase [Herbiconiux sp. CPCC 205716]|uniref:Class I SAM-dependent methyltransferase n=1 Tax=Herbiconiux gentiana TaxID=2970912 RepID=A0ABT2GGS7_9MICO|nr:class I SAM-dependent methyltransferase [Herbiconiux gentiana]MCS5715439.1 class I SAM-dependent methyltransferase [Herbiconiux gentiana]
MNHMNPDPNTDPTAFWEELYQQRERVWSGRANAALVAVAAGLEPGRALDLGCGEGGDSIWLAEQGWRVTGVDISATALGRAATHAASRGVEPDRIEWVQADLSDWRPDGGYELVSACFLHSPVAFPREQVLQRAALPVARGGHLLVVGHAEFPNWTGTREEGHGHPELPTAEEVFASLELPEDEWEVVVAEPRSRDAVGPDGQEAVLVDSVLLVRRR